MSGLRPVVEIMFFDFVTLAMDQLVNQAAKMRYMSGGAYSVPMVVRTLCGSGRGSGPQHSQQLEAWLAGVPGLRVVVPSDPADAKGLLAAAIRADDPVVVIESSRLWTVRGEVPEGEHVTDLATGRTVRSGTDVTIVAWGWALTRATAAADELAAAGVSAEVLDLRTLCPLDDSLILGSLERTGRLMVVHDATEPFGPGAEICALAASHGFTHLRAPVVRLTPPFAPAPFPTHLEQSYYPQPSAISAAARRLVGV